MTIVKIPFLLGMLVLPALVFAQEEGEFPSLETPRYEIRQTGKGEPWYDPMRGGRTKFTFAVNDIIAGSENTFVLDNLTSEVLGFEIFGEKLLILGVEATSRASVITVVRLKNGVVEDTLMGYSPTFSPSRRYIVFRKYFSVQTADPPKQSDLILLYDLEKSADENRVRGLDAYRNDPIGRLTEVGRPVFPETNAKKKRYRVWVREEGSRHSILSGGFFWLNGAKHVSFIDRVGGKFYFVVIDTRSPGKKSSIHRGEFDPLSDDDEENVESKGDHGNASAEDPRVTLKNRFKLEKVELLKTGDLQIDLLDTMGEEQTWQFPPEAFVPPFIP